MAIWFALWNRGDWQPWNHMYCLSSSSSPCIRWRNQLNGEALACKSHIATLNELTESEVSELTSSTDDETALSIVKKQGSCGITLVSLQRKFISTIQLNLYWLKWETKRSTLAAKDIETSEFHQDMWNRYLMLVYVSAHIPRIDRSNLELQCSSKALRIDPILPSGMTFSNLCRKKYAETMHAIQKQLPSWNKVSLAFDRWMSTNKLVITAVIAYYMDQNWALREVHLTLTEVDCLFFSWFES